MPVKKKLIVIGGGAAGFFCAVNAASQNENLEVIILEKSNKLLSKVRVSGGGRCNVTHACFSIAEMIKKYPRGENFLKQAFHHFFTTDTIEWFQQRNVKLKTEADGRMFPESNSSETIIECLIREANKFNIQILMNREVQNIETIFWHQHSANGNKYFKLNCKDGSSFDTDFVCIACGGYNKMQQYEWLNKLGHSFEPPIPSLFTFNIPANSIVELMGISVEDVIVKINETKFKQQGALLITHWGLSGPAILKLSAFAAKKLFEFQYQFSISVNWCPGYNENSILSQLKILSEK